MRMSLEGFITLALISALTLAASVVSGKEETSPEAQLASRILEETGVKGGLIVHIGCGDGRLTAALHLNDRYLVQGLDRDEGNVERARSYIRSLGLYGKVSIDLLRGERLPYSDNLVNLLLCEGLGEIPMDEVMRVLAPGGVAYIKEGEGWIKRVKPWPKKMDEWTHYLHDATNNAVAHDLIVGPPRHLRWVAKPLYCRSHEIDSSVSALVSARGRIFYILDEGPLGITDERLPSKWSLVARDAFNGLLLWKRPLPHWGWREWKRSELEGKDWTKLRGQRIRSPSVLPRRLVAAGDRVYVTLGYNAPVSALDAATGKTIRTYEGTEGTDEILFKDNMLILCVRKKTSEGKTPETILALNADTGEVLWRHDEERILPLTLAAGRNGVFFYNSREIVGLDLKTGREMWRTPCEGAKGSRWTAAATLVVHDGVVLFVDPRRFVALSAKDGRILWTGSGNRGPGVANPPDLFVADGLVWYGGFEGVINRKKINVTTDVKKTGHDLRTGDVKRVVEAKNLITPGHHFRCYRSKATDRYLLWPKRGIEFIDLKGHNHMRHDWLRAPCKLGFMPCNGLLYMPPHQCFCYPGAKLSGFLALAAEDRSGSIESETSRLERGPAYGAVIGGEGGSKTEEWPTFRHDPKRSGSVPFTLPARLKRSWEVDLGGRLTQPVVAGGKLFIADVDEHRVCCLDARNGKELWSCIAGGRVDSPPTIHQGLVLFGSADGWVYCLRSSDGKLVWRFRAAPKERLIVAFGQLESAWPVHGSVLVKDGLVYFAAGRSSFLDGGIYVYALDPMTGKLIHQAKIEGPYPDLAKDVGRPFDMDGTKADVLVTDGDFLYMGQAKLDGELRIQQIPRITRMGDRDMGGMHLISTAGLLDDSWWNRTFWMYSKRWPGYYIANRAPKTGQLLAFDETTTYGVKVYTKRNVHSPMFFPATGGYLLFADDNENEPLLTEKAANKDKGIGFTRGRPPKWQKWVPIRIRAMVLAGENLFVAGPPDVLDPKDPLAALQDRSSAMLWVLSASDGRKLAEYKLKSSPVFDGMIAAEGRLYISTRDGRVICFE